MGVPQWKGIDIYIKILVESEVKFSNSKNYGVCFSLLVWEALVLFLFVFVLFGWLVDALSTSVFLPLLQKIVRTMDTTILVAVTIENLQLY